MPRDDSLTAAREAEQLRTILEATELGFWDANLATGQTVISASYAAMLGYQPEEIANSNKIWHEGVHPKDRERVFTATDQLFSKEQPLFDEEYRLRTKAGEWKWFRARGAITEWDEAGNPLRFVGTMLDITRRHQAEEHLHDSENLFETAFRNAFHGMVLSSRQGVMLRVNEAFQKMVGYGPELVGMRLEDILHPEELQQSQADRSQIQQTPEQIYLTRRRLRTKSGESLQTQVAVSSIVDPQGGFRYFLAQVEDLTPMLELQDELVRAERVGGLAVLAGSLGHELSSPLGAIQMSIGILIEDIVQERHESALGLAKEIAKSADHGLEVIHNLRKLQREGRQEPIRMSLEKLVRDTIPLIEPLRRKMQVQLEIGLPRGNPVVLGNPVELQQVATNLATNALYAMANRPERRLTLRTFVEDDCAVLEVQDTGIGILEENLSKIFQPFYTTRTSAGGTGFGLAVCQSIVNRHSGKLRVDSIVDAGTTFRMELPQVENPGPA